MSKIDEAAAHRPLASYDWARAEGELDAEGWTLLPGLLAPAACAALALLYDMDSGLRDRIVMARHGFGRGEYRYFDYPLPPLVQALREALYGRLVGTANRWQERLGLPGRFPAGLEAFLSRCGIAGQTRATPLLLRYGAGDFNRLHQDKYGPLVFPLQATVLLSPPGRGFAGGEFVLTERQARRQSRATVVPLQQGDAVLFAGALRPSERGSGWSRAELRHGVSVVRSGRRTALGVIFHDAP